MWQLCELQSALGGHPLNHAFRLSWFLSSSFCKRFGLCVRVKMAAGCLLSLKNKNFLWWCFKKSITALLCFLLCDKLVRSRSSSPFHFLSSPSSSFILSRSTRSTLNTLNAQRSIILFTRGHLHLHHLRHRLHSPSTSTHNLEQTSRLGQFDCLPLNKQNSERSGLATVFLTHFTTQPCPSRTEQKTKNQTKRNKTRRFDENKTNGNKRK